MNKNVSKLENPTEEDRTTTKELRQTLEQYTNLFANDPLIDDETKVDEILTLYGNYEYLSKNVIAKDVAQKMINGLKDLIEFTLIIHLYFCL